MNQEIVLRIPGIHCAGCTTSIKRVLEATPGISAIDVDAKTKLASLTFDDSGVSLERIQESLKRIGFNSDEEG